MNYFERRKWSKIVGHLQHEAAHARHMRLDIAAPADLQALKDADALLKNAWKSRDVAQLEAAAQAVSDAVSVVFPQRPKPRLREHVEIIAVAVTIALGFRTYFVQPFKIPTGSMQPTLYGIDVQPQNGAKLMDRFPLNLVDMALFGERYVEVRAKASGVVEFRNESVEDELRFYVAGVPHMIRAKMQRYFQPGTTYVEKGQLLASGRVRIGDHIFVNKVRYNFVRPKRGDIFVFSTDGIKDERVRPDSFYIKRMAGLPGEEVWIDPPHLVVNNGYIEWPDAFRRLIYDREDGYGFGYQLPQAHSTPAVLAKVSDRLKLSPTQYLPLGDNTLYSLDGRYFGPVDRQHIVGPAFAVYWPFSHRWGFVE